GFSLLFLAILYGLRTRQERFVFGVYIAWGADTRRLALSSGLELLICAATTYVPAAVAGALLAKLCSHIAGGTFYLCLRLCLWVFPCVSIASFVAAYLRTRVLAFNQPVELLSARESSDLAVSPRRSSVTVRESFPRRYELISLWRFRRFMLSTALSFAICAATFFFAVTCAGAIDNAQEYIAEHGVEYVLRLNDGGDQAVAYKGLSDIEGIAHISEDVPEADARTYSHLVSIKSSSVNKKGITAANPYLADQSLTDYFRICACNPVTANILADTFTVEGDVTAFTGGYDVIVGETLENDKAFSFAPGDKITLWVYVNSRGSVEEGSQGAYKISQMAEKYIYKTITLNVVAVVKDAPSPNKGFALYVADELYPQLTGFIPAHDTLKLSFDKDAEPLAVLGHVNALNDMWALGTVEYTGEQTDNAAVSAEGWARVLTAGGFALIAISLLPLAYSLGLFYRKRGGEIAVLRAMFADRRSIIKLHLWDIPAFFLCCVAVTVPLCLVSVRGAALFCDRLLPNLFFVNMPILTENKAEPMFFVIIVAAALLCVAVSCAVCCVAALGEDKTEKSKKLYSE
ncbi:MAG: hypothetical protein IJN63_07675, partial [Clostridia bacterium]|nr:hypothetical protein [Clostridia bacterium]